jgi:phosphoglycolate phosphatase
MTRYSGHRLVLFDIDGTILHGGKLWRECFEGSVCAQFRDLVLPRISFSGKTDRQICREIMEASGLLNGILSEKEEGWRESQIDQVIAGYLARVREKIEHRAHEVRLLPGVRELVEELGRVPEVALGLLTGNVREGAQLKLASVGMDHYFDFGVYGDDHWDRYELPAIAAARALETHGLEYLEKQIVIIGDTVHDVNCGRILNVRTIAVGTGQADQRPLILEARPDYFFEDLSDTDAVLRAVLGEVGSPALPSKASGASFRPV